MMEDPGRLSILLRDLISHPAETEWIEFKENNEDPREMGEYLSALSNSALLAGQPHGYLCFGIENATHRLVGTRVDPSTLKVGAEPIEPWLARMLEPRIDFSIRTATIDGLPIVIFEVDAARSRPVAFSGVEYIRIGSHKKKLKDYPDREGKIWNKVRGIAFEDGIAARAGPMPSPSRKDAKDMLRVIRD